MESYESFAGRVRARTGRDLADLQRLPPEALLGGQILVRRGRIYVVTVGYPTLEADDIAIYHDFGVVVL